MKLDQQDFDRLSTLYNDLTAAEEKLGRMAAKKALVWAKLKAANPQLFAALDDMEGPISELSTQLLVVREGVRKLNQMIKVKYEIEGEFTISMADGQITPKPTSQETPE